MPDYYAAIYHKGHSPQLHTVEPAPQRMTGSCRLDMFNYAVEHHVVKQVQNKRLGFCRLPRDGVLGANRRLYGISELSEVDPDQATGESLDIGTGRWVALNLGEQAA